MIEHTFSFLINPLSSFFEKIASKKITSNGLWYLSPEDHAREFILFNFLMILLFYITLRKGNASAREHGNYNRGDNDLNNSRFYPSQHKTSLQTLPMMLKVYRGILTVCLIVTVLHKWNGNKLPNLLMPCHITTFLLLYSLWSLNYQRAETVFNVSIYFMFFTWLAIAVPDLRDLNQFGERINFWVHHWILAIIPLHILYTEHYRVNNEEHYYLKLTICFGIFIHYDVMLIAAIMTGFNVGYMLFPPPGSPFKGVYFRFQLFICFVVLGSFCGYIVPIMIKGMRRWIHFSATDSENMKKIKSKAN